MSGPEDALVAWLQQQLTDDETLALGACRPVPAEARNDKGDSWALGTVPAEVFGRAESVAGTKNAAAAAHIARHDPARVLANVAAMREVIALHSLGDDGFDDGHECDGLWFSDRPCRTLTALAQPFAGRNGWQEEWAL